MTDDPFDRAVQRAAELSWRRRMGIVSVNDALRFMTTFQAVLLTAWGLIVLGHWAMVKRGTVLQIHVVVFALAIGVFVVMQVMFRTFGRRWMDFGDDTTPPT